MKLIDKDALVAEIEKRIKEREEEEKKGWAYSRVKIVECEHILSFINSLPEEPVSSIWHNFSEELPPIGVSVIAYHHLWVDEDFNPQGTRIGFLQDNLASDDCKYDFISAHWWNEQDTYMTISKIDIEGNEEGFSEEIKSSIIPEYWIEIPSINSITKTEESVSEDFG